MCEVNTIIQQIADGFVVAVSLLHEELVLFDNITQRSHPELQSLLSGRGMIDIAVHTSTSERSKGCVIDQVQIFPFFCLNFMYCVIYFT